MIFEPTYQKSFLAALFLHLLLGFLLLAETSSKKPVLVNETQNTPGQVTPIADAKPQSEVVKAVSVDSKAVMEKVNQLRAARAAEIKAEQARQQALVKQAETMKQVRIQEQQRLLKLKQESVKLALARKKQLEEEQKHLKELAVQKEQETKRLQEMRRQEQEMVKKQQQEAAKLAELKKKQEALDAKKKSDAAKALAEDLKKKQEADAKAAADKAAADKAAREKAATDAAEQARMAGEVDKYKAMILNAIGQRWILPDNVNPSLSCQFHIRLAPDGSVMEVSLTRSSGDPILDRSAQTAIYKASPLPVPSDPSTFNLFRDISLTVRPENVRG